VIEVADLDEYRRSLSGNPELERLLAEWSSTSAARPSPR
jgi:hypothetical protein